MKIAIATDDGETVSRHFGQAGQYMVVEAENGRVVTSELREKLTRAQLAGESHEHDQPHWPGQSHGFGPGEQKRHEQMLAPINDCQVVLSGGMRAPMYHSLQEAGIKPVMTDIRSINKAVDAFLDGTLKDRPDLVLLH